MERLFITMVLGGALLSQASAAPAQAVQAAVSASAIKPDNSGGHFTDVPPLPRGKSTILGGSIQNVDPVRDQFVLHVYGEKPMRILFDERTQLFRDGKKIALRDLGPAMHSSVQTTLDGANIFAISVHILSQQANGDYQGRVLSYNPGTGILMLTSATNRAPFRVQVSNQTSFKRLGQSAFSSVPSSANDLVPGSLVTVEFESDNKGKGMAQTVSVLAAPGATFVFSGNVVSLDMHTGSVVVVDPRDDQRYQIFFDPTHVPASSLRAGQNVRISADYDGKRYVATEIAAE
jgi:hypothetical protein